MGRLAMQPRFNEVEHLPNGDVESWDPVATAPTGWTLNGGANGVASLETDIPFEGRNAAKLIKNGSGNIFWSLTPKQPMIPGFYYRATITTRRGLLGTVGLQNSAKGQLRNVTRSTSLNTSSQFSAGSLPFTVASGTLFRSFKRWFQIPLTYSDADSWTAEMGVFGSQSGGADTWYDSFSLIGPFVRPVHMVGLAALTSAALSRKEIVVTLTGPNGLELDITRRVKLDGLGTITEGAEEEILRLTHGDMTLTLDDRDEMLRGLFESAAPTDRWELVVLTETGRSRGLKWDRLFAGVLDLPWSVTFSPKEQETTLQVFSYTKALDNISATGVGRIVTGRTFTISVGSKNATTNDTTDLRRGDRITARVSVSGVSTQESFTVDRVDSATAFRVTANAMNAFAGADLSLDTYFYREKTATFLAGEVCDAASVLNREINLLGDVASFPLAHPIATHGLGFSTIPMSFVPVSGDPTTSFLAADETKRKTTTGPTAPWTDGATSNLTQLDWTPYLTSEPGTIQTLVGVGNDGGSTAPDHTTGWVYYNFLGPSQFELHRRQNSGADINLGPWSGFLAGRPPTLIDARVEFAPPNNRVFLSYYNVVADGTRKFRYYDVGGAAFFDIDLNHSGDLRWIRYGSGGLLVLVNNATSAEPESAYKHANEIELWDAAGPTKLRTFPWPNRTDNILAWTMRTWGVGATWFTFLFQRSNEERLSGAVPRSG